MSEWGLSNPEVANAVLMRQEHIKRAEKEAAQREKEADPVYRYHRLMRKVAQSNLDPDGVSKPAKESSSSSSSSSKKKKNSSSEQQAGSGGGGGWGMRSNVAQDRARNIKKKKQTRNLPAAWAMPPIDQKEED
jgi:hypothetical protein